MNRAGIATIAAGPAVIHIGLFVGLVGERPVAVRVNAAGIRLARRPNGTLANNRAANASLGARLAGRRCTGRRSRRHVAGANGVRRRISAGQIDLPVAVVIDAVADFGARVNRADAHERAALALECSELAGEHTADTAASAGIGDVVVDGAVAVVVDAVAEFGLRTDFTDADERTRLALNRSERTGAGVCLAAGSACTARAVVDCAIAVIVDAVAGFGLRTDGADASQRAALALRGAEFTGARVRRAALAAGAARAVVDNAVAVVVNAVAGFAGRVDRADTNQRARLALHRPKRAGEGIVLAAGNACSRRIVVDHAVAVVIDAVAGFRLRADRANAGKSAGLARNRSKFAGARVGRTALAADSAGAVVDGAVAVVVDAIAGFRLRIDGTHAGERAALALNRSELAGAYVGLTALAAGARRVVVDGAVAVVVDAVAGFRLRIDSTHAIEHARLANHRSKRARSVVALAARHTGTRRIVVYGAVAVVVDVVAGLLHGVNGAHAGERSVYALNRSELARSDIGLAALAADAARIVVHGAVAVVVDTVAGFRLRTDFACAHQRAALAGDRSKSAGTRIGLAALAADTDGIVVDHSVAVIVGTIAGFLSSRIHRADAGQRACLA